MQVVNANGIISKPPPIIVGAILERVLGPLVFLLYTNNSFHITSYGIRFLFTDDIVCTTLYALLPLVASALCIYNVSSDLLSLG